MDFEFKKQTTQKEQDTQHTSRGTELSPDDLGAVVGGKASMKGVGTIDFTCPYCGQTLKVRDTQEASRHCNQDCPNSPYK